MLSWQAVVLGIVEGITEFLPVSSTGHLILTQRILGLPDDDAWHAYAICIQAGAIAAVFGLYWPRVRQMFSGLAYAICIQAGAIAAVFGLYWRVRQISAGRAGRHRDGVRLLVKLAIAFVPAVVIGLLFEKKIDQYLFGLKPVVAAWLIGGLAIVCVTRLRAGAVAAQGKSVEQIEWKNALAIGLWQCLALWPGTSRSLATIAGGLAVGLALPAAVEFSLLLGLVTLLAATAHKALGHGTQMLDAYGGLNIALGFLVAFVAAWSSVRWMVGYLKRRLADLHRRRRLREAAALDDGQHVLDLTQIHR